MSLGRNEPCHCGSGKKYKKCCLSKDQEAALKKATEPEPTPANAPAPIKFTPPSNPRMDAWNARWEEFDQADYEARLELFYQTLNEPELMDKEMVFEMTHRLFEQTIEHDERDRFDALLEALRERLPVVYENEAYNLLDWRISNALAGGQVELAGKLTREYAGHIHKHIDNWKWIENRMAYHGQVAALAETMRKAWPQVRHSTEIVPWGVDEFFSRALNYELLDYVDTHSSPSADDPELLERMKFYGDEIITERLASSLACLTGQMQRQWRLDDFRLKPLRRSRLDWDEEEGKEDNTLEQEADNLFALTMQFVGYAHQVEGENFGKAELARHELHHFILRRHGKELEYRENILESLSRSGGKKRAPSKKFPAPRHLLCPDYERLDIFLADLLDFISPQRHCAVAMMELTPTWLRFLEAQGLIDEQLRREIFSQLSPLAGQLRDVVKGDTSDPALAQALAHWNDHGLEE